MRRSPVLLAAALVTLTATACGSSDDVSSSAPVTTTAATTAARTEAQTHRLLEDTWVTPVVTRSQVLRGLADAGYARYADTVALDLGYPAAFSLRFDEQHYWMRTASGLQPDHGSWELHGDRLVLIPTGCDPCQLHFAWRLQDDVLQLGLVRDTSPEVDGVPDVAYARALYSTVPLTRFAAS